jgi:Protein of unknown function (DUF667)
VVCRCETGTLSGSPTTIFNRWCSRSPARTSGRRRRSLRRLSDDWRKKRGPLFFSTTYISCPADAKKTLGIKLPFLVMIVKNMKRYFTFEVTILDDKGVKRRFRASNYQSNTRVKPFICTMPMRLDEGWNQIQFNLADFCKRAYGTTYVETLRVQVHANCRIRRVYFADRLYTEDELPPEFKLYLPVQNRAP